MGGERFQEQDTDSFFGNFVYDRVIPEDHFLRRLDALVPWEKLTKRLVGLYRGKARQGRPPYNPALLLKMLLVTYLYDLSERQSEEVANYNLPVKWFLGLAVDEAAPDHSTLTRFRNRLIEAGNLDAVEGLLQEVVALALEAGIEFGSVQVMDSVHTVADVNPEKDRRRQDRDDEPPRDGDAQWGVKGSRRVAPEPGSGRTVSYFYGFKAHCSLNAEAELITSVEVTPGNRHDGQLLPALLEKELQQEVPLQVVAADRAYDDGNNHYLLEHYGLRSAIHLNDYRTQKKDGNKEVWLRLRASESYQEGLAERYKIERKFGEAKQNHGLGRCRYLGLLRYGLQAFLTAIALNLKRMVKVLTGTPFKAPVRAAV